MEKQEWASIEADIEAIENRIAEIEVEMNENGSDFGKLSALQKELIRKMSDCLRSTIAMNTWAN